MKLNNLKPAAGSTHSRRRIGRGTGSGLGGTSTRGHKGAKSRSGYKRKIGFERVVSRISTIRNTLLLTCLLFKNLLRRRILLRLDWLNWLKLV